MNNSNQFTPCLFGKRKRRSKFKGNIQYKSSKHNDFIIGFVVISLILNYLVICFTAHVQVIQTEAQPNLCIYRGYTLTKRLHTVTVTSIVLFFIVNTFVYADYF